MEASEVLNRAASFFGARGRYWETFVRVGIDSDLEEAAVAAKMRVAAELTGMVLMTKPELPQFGREIELRRVEDAQDVQDFANTTATGFLGEAPGISELIRAIFSDPRTLLANDTAAFVAWEGSKPLSTAMTMVKEGVAWIGWVSTRADARGRGLGALTTAAVTRAGFGLGARFASLEATKMGAPVYARLGYRETLRYRTYWPEEFAV
jgi:GNAT superfamily N-acetyltransferase